jgi:hypothetical protein
MPSTIDAIIRIKASGSTGSQVSLASQESTSAASSAEQVKHLIGHLVRGGHLTRKKNFVEKNVVVNILQSNVGLFPTLKESNISQSLMKNGYLEYQLSPDIYNFHMNKIMPFIEANESNPAPRTPVKTPAKTLMKKAKSMAELDASVKKQDQIERYFEYMVREGHLTVENNVVDRCVVNNALHSDASEGWPALKSANIGHQLMTAGLLDFQITPGTYNFHKEKIARVLEKIETETVGDAFAGMKINVNLKQQAGGKFGEQEQVDLLVKQLVKEKVLTMFNTIVKKASVREVFQNNKHMFPGLKIGGDEVSSKIICLCNGLEFTQIFHRTAWATNCANTATWTIKSLRAPTTSTRIASNTCLAKSPRAAVTPKSTSTWIR